MLDVLPKLSERRWQGQVVALARLFGWRWWHDVATNAPRACPHCKHPLKLPRNDPGWPDLFMVRGDRLVIVELKSDRGKVTDDQREWLAALAAIRRVEVFVARPKDAETIAKVLR